jgi:kumamolisin
MAAISQDDYIPWPGSVVSGRVDPEEPIQVTMVVRSRTPAPPLHTDKNFATLLPVERLPLTREQFEVAHGAHPDDLGRIEKFARQHELAVVQSSAARRRVVLAGSCAAFSRIFQIEMLQFMHQVAPHRGIRGRVRVPESLAGIVQAVLGLHNRPCVRRHVPSSIAAKPENILRPHEVAELYRFPRAHGKGQCIGVIELGGGYHLSDLEAFFSSLKMPAPKVTDILVDDAVNKPADQTTLSGFMGLLCIGGKFRAKNHKHVRADARDMDLAQSTVEATMDLELAAAFAPKASIVVYFAPNSEQGIFSALSAALADKQHKPSVLSLSWGEVEPIWSPLYMKLINDLLREAATLGITVCVSSGDYGSSNGLHPSKPVVNFPASSPYALGCGGTSFKSSRRTLTWETVWNATYRGIWGASGGGISEHFRRPPWQAGFLVPLSPGRKRNRGVPDVAGPADPTCGCRIVVGGYSCSSAGTSAVAPFWAGLIARLNQEINAPVGYLNPLLYTLARRAPEILREVTSGNNGDYQAGQSWNACTGLGSPVGERLLESLQSRAAFATRAAG